MSASNLEAEPAAVADPVDTGAGAAGAAGPEVVEASAADDIAAKLIGILVGGFKAKQQRDPTESELDELLSELTEDRINAMLGLGSGVAEEPEEDEQEQEGVGTEEGEEEADTEAVAGVEEAGEVEAEMEMARGGQSDKEETKNGEACDEENAVGNKRKVDATDSTPADAATAEAKKSLAFSWPSFTAKSQSQLEHVPAADAAAEDGDEDEAAGDRDCDDEEAVLPAAAPVQPNSFAFAWPSAAAATSQ